jgi:SpoVK/Ycf46/Vps4 family AAA+-type ATPase
MRILISEIPEIDTDKELLIPRLSTAVNNVLEARYNIRNPRVLARFFKQDESGGKAETVVPKKTDTGEEKPEEAQLITLREPEFSFDQLVLDDSVFEELKYAVNFERIRDKVYYEWGLEKIEPSPKLALNFWGPSGTGKTMAAQALAQAMRKKIILASYAEIESKYHGDGPKNVKRLFQYASENDAVLFIDEADSLLSKRLTNVTQGSEQAINSMRSQLLIQIEQYKGVVIFATNLASNYDSAFITRIKSVQFKTPDQRLRRQLWEKMLIPALPKFDDIDCENLSAIDGVCGRDIKNAIVKAAIKAAIDGTDVISHQLLETSIKSILESNKQVSSGQIGNLTEAEKKVLGQKVKLALRKQQHFKKHHLK